MIKDGIFNIVYWYRPNFVIIPFFHTGLAPGLSLTVWNLHREPFSMFLSVRYLLVLTMRIDPVQHRITGVILDPLPFLVFSSVISSSPSCVRAMSYTTVDTRLCPDSIKHSTNKTLSGGSSLLWIEEWFSVMYVFHALNLIAFLS